MSRGEGFRAVVHAHVARLTPRPTRVIYDRVIGEWGDVTRRSVERALSDLRRAGAIVSGPDGHMRARSR